VSRVASQLSVNKPVSHEWSFANVLFRTFDALASITLFWISAQVYFSLFGILREIFTNFSSFLKENSINCKKKPECNKLMSSSVPMNENSCTPRSFMSPTPGESRAVSRNSNFGLQLQPLKVFGSGSRTIWFIKNQKPFYYLYNWLAPKTMSVEQELKVQAPTPQPWLKDTSLSTETNKVARRPWAPRFVLEFDIKTSYVLDSWKTSCCPWISSDVLENSWIVFKLHFWTIDYIEHSRIKNKQCRWLTTMRRFVPS